MDYTDLYIDGTWHQTAERFDVINPATEEVLASVASAEIADADKALDAAEKAMGDWAARSPRDRSEVLRRAWELMTERRDHFAHLMTLENGKAGVDARGEAAYAAEFFRWFAEEAVRADGLITHAPASGARIVVQHKPAGLAVLVTPWNYPAAMGTRKIAPALAAGCGVIIKPASETPLTMLALMPLLEEAGVPPGLVNVLPSRRTGALVDHMLHDPRVRVVSFTGSTGVGRKLLKSAADQVLKPAMELGGNAPFIVFDDADIDAAVDGAILCKFRNNGQTCVCANRIYVQAGVYDEFAQKLKDKVSGMKVGDGLEEGTDLGPLINADALTKVQDHIADAKSKGADVILGEQEHRKEGNFFGPTIVTGATRDMAFATEETFGPLAPLFKFETEDDVIELANDTIFGLASYFYANDLSRVYKVAEALEYGIVGVNTGIISTEVAPFGGVKQSGLGREGSHHGIDDFLEMKYVCMSV